MKHNGREAKIFAVVQFGGSSGEFYLHTFSKIGHANSYINRAERSGYECSEVFEILLPAEGELLRIAAKTVNWLKREGYEQDKHTLDLERAMLEVRKDLSLD